MMKRSSDFLIVGFGLAGSAMYRHLVQKGASVQIIDSTGKHKSSWAAAGLYNPITGRKMVKTWLADELFDYLEPYYQSLETELGVNCLHKLPIYRPFLNASEQNDWMAKTADPAYSPFIEKIVTRPEHKHFNDKFGGIWLKKCGYLDIPPLLEKWADVLRKQDVLVNKNFEFDALEFYSNHVKYNGSTFSKVIFCEGTHLRDNPFLSWLPLRPNKGELLDIQGELQENFILNRGVFVLPRGKAFYRVGSTYNHQDTTLDPTEQGKNTILDKLGKLINVDIKIREHRTGIRPATKDRKPLIGIHPEIETIGVLNGLGSKGVSLAPYFAAQFAAHLTDGINLADEVNIQRYFSLYFNSQQT